jgi:hypothetical protein
MTIVRNRLSSDKSAVYLSILLFIIIKFCLIICISLIFYYPSAAGWLRPRRLNIISHSFHDDRCREFKALVQKVDHFGFINMDTFEERYILNTDYWQNGRPIFFYTGNEGLM